MIRHLAPILVLTALLLALAGGTAASARPNVAPVTIATAGTTDFRADLVAQRASSGSAPTATVTLTTFRRAGSTWHKLTSKHLTGAFFWKTVSRPRAICRFEIATAVHADVTVQLLTTPSLGCGKVTTLPLSSR